MANEDYGLKPVNGIVQPPVIPPEGKSRQNSNQLLFIHKIVLKAVMKHHFAWTFLHPVNAIKLNLPNYHDIIKTPMDLNTIKKRIENCYYSSVQECQIDFTTIFTNCYRYNKPGEDVVLMAKAVEKEYNRRLANMPKEFKELPLPNIKTPGNRGKGKKGKGAGRPKGSCGGTTAATLNASGKNSPSTTLSSASVNNSVLSVTNVTAFASPPTRATAASPPTRAAAIAIPPPTRAVAAPPPTRASAAAIDPLSVPGDANVHTSHSSSQSVSPPTLRHSSYALPANYNQTSSALRRNHDDIKSSHSSLPNASSSEPACASETSAKVKKGVKRKADTTPTSSNRDPAVQPCVEKGNKVSTRRESGRPIKRPFTDLPDSQPNLEVTNSKNKSKMSEQMKYYHIVLKELFLKKHSVL